MSGASFVRLRRSEVPIDRFEPAIEDATDRLEQGLGPFDAHKRILVAQILRELLDDAAEFRGFSW